MGNNIFEKIGKFGMRLHYIIKRQEKTNCMKGSRIQVLPLLTDTGMT